MQGELKIVPSFVLAQYLENADQQTLQDTLVKIQKLKDTYEQFPKGYWRYDTARKLSESFIESTRNEPHEDKKEITCRKGCSFCCHTKVDIQYSEAHMLYQVIRKYPSEFPLYKLKKQAGKEHKDYYMMPKEDSKCIFLGDDGTCSVYSIRPMNCRGYFSVGDPEECNTTDPNKMIDRFISLTHEMNAAGLSGCEGEVMDYINPDGVNSIADTLIWMLEKEFGKKKAKKMMSKGYYKKGKED